MKRVFILCWLCGVLLIPGRLAAQDNQGATGEPRSLLLNQAIERELSGGQTHTYQIELKVGEFLNVEVDQRNIDVLVDLSAPDGKLLIEMDSKGGRLWRETLSCVAEVNSTYRLIVQAREQQASAGQYKVRVAEKRAAVDRDRKRLSAEQALSDGRRLFEQGNSLPAVVKSYQEAIVLWRELREPYWEAVTLTNLGWALTASSKDNEAIAAHTAALAVFREVKDRTGEGRSLNGLGNAYVDLRQNERARDYYEQALIIRREVKDRSGEGNTLFALANAYYNLRQYEKAREYYDLAVALRHDVKDRVGEANSLVGLGSAYYQLTQYEKAGAVYEQARGLAHDAKDSNDEEQSLFGLGNAHYQLRRYDQARDDYEQALAIARAVKDRSSEGNTLQSLGNVYYNLKQYQKARDYYEQTLAVWLELKDRSNEGNTLQSLGNVYYNLKQYQKARDYYEQTLAIWRELKDRNGEGNSLMGLGNVFHSLNLYEKARDYFEQSLAIKRELKDRKGEALALISLGHVYNGLSQPEKARDYYEQALVIEREVQDRVAATSPLEGLGNAYLQLGQYEKARDYIEQSLVIVREVKDSAGESRALYNLGNVYSRLSQYDKAREDYEQSLAIAQSVNDRSAEGRALVGLGDISFFLSEFEKARHYFERALLIARELEDRRSEGNPLGGLGNVYIQLGQYEKARDYHEQALTIWREVKDRHREGSTLMGLGQAYEYLRQYDKARDYYQQALVISRDAKYRDDESNTLHNLGNVCVLLGQYEQARDYLEQALAIFREVRNRDGEGNSLNSLGVIYYRHLGQYEQARDYFEQALAATREVRNRTSESGALDNLMLLWRKLDRPRLAIFYGKQAVNVLQEIRGDLRQLEKESQKSFLEANERPYRRLAGILIETGRLAEAEQVLALLKDQEYSGLLRRGGEPPSDVGYSPAEAETVKIQTQLADIGRERSNLLALSEKHALDEQGKQRLDQIERDLIPKANTQLRLALENISKEAPDLTARTTEIKEAQSLMRYLRELGPGTVALYTVISTDKERIDKGWIILVTPDFRKAYAIDVKDLGQTIALFRQALSSPRHDPQPLAEKLYRMLFLNPQANGPTLAVDLQTYLRDQKDKTLMWSLDGVLRYVPMAALHDGEKYLVERYRNVVFTTASLAGLTHAVSRDWKALGLGVSKQYPGFEALAGARRELAAVVRDAGNKSAGGALPGTTKLDDQFTEKAMMDGLREGFSVVHIATHFSYQPADPAASFLLLGDGSHLETAKFEDSANIFEKTELLTLSACDTANGSGMKDANGKDAESLAYVSQKLGAQSVIASLWPVDDVGTQVLMPLFYRLRLTGLTKAEAFQRAQLALLYGAVKDVPGVTRSSQVVSEAKSAPVLNAYTIDPQRPFAHPYFWAPFVLIGNWK